MLASSEKAKHWQGLIHEWRTSGQSKKEFAKSRGLSLDVMNDWLAKFNKSAGSIRDSYPRVTNHALIYPHILSKKTDPNRWHSLLGASMIGME